MTEKQVSDSAVGTQFAASLDLRNREVRPPRNWAEWLTLWEIATTSTEMLGLLHGGFDVRITQCSIEEPEYSKADRLIFYMGVADCWTDMSNFSNLPGSETTFHVSWDNEGRELQQHGQEIRQNLAEKAFSMLCLRYFKKVPEGTYYDENLHTYWQEVISNEPLFNAIVNFFRVEKNRFGIYVAKNLRDCSWEHYSNNDKIAISFLISFANSLWHWREHETLVMENDTGKTKWVVVKCDVIIRKRIEAAKTVIIETLDKLGRLDVLEPVICDLGPECIAKLEEIALRSYLFHHFKNHNVLHDRLVTSLDEACIANSQAAWFLKRREILIGVRAKLEEVLEAQKRLEEAEKEVERLSGHKA